MAVEIAHRFEERLKTTQETLVDLWKLKQQIDAAEQEREASDLPANAFAVYLRLKQDNVEKAYEVGKAARGALRSPEGRGNYHHQTCGVRSIRTPFAVSTALSCPPSRRFLPIPKRDLGYTTT